ncbi:hypothetical protein ACNQFN_09400 [Thauera butanivorans]|uniref:hypothetical protein n=1 Tax=Thauera butanivorans TaxID=86174 RepID=UPI003AB83D7F
MAHDIEKLFQSIQEERDGRLDPREIINDALKMRDLIQRERDARLVQAPMAQGRMFNGPTYAKLEAALIAFPGKYGNSKPKLDADVRPWLQQEFECSAREASVFGAILAEHFSLDRRSR